VKVVIQRVKRAQVEVDQKIVGSIQYGLLLYVCFEQNDAEVVISKAIEKIMALRIFEDDQGRMNKNINDVNGEILSISQFTLSWDGRKGNRPSFDLSLHPATAQLYYSLFNNQLRIKNIKIETGVFGANMQVESVNDGPVTFHLSF
jgi:D-aminoacyl-tRNA deacylase